MESANALWELLAAAGGGLALTFIVLLVLGLVALTLFFVGSAVVVLDRFARVAKSPVRVVAWGLALCLLAASILVRSQSPELSVRPWSEWLAQFSVVAAALAVVVTISIAISWLALNRLRSAVLGAAVMVVLGLGAALWIGALANPLYAAAPAAVVLAFALALAARRSWRSGGAAPARGDVERDLYWLAGTLALALPLALLLREPSDPIAMAGAAVTQVFFSIVLFGLLPLAAAGLSGMRRSVEWFIGVRYLVAKRRQVFISAITTICVLGIAAGVWLIVIVLSVMNGFEKTWRDEILGNRAHFTVHSGFGPFGEYEGVLEAVRAVPGVTAASPFLDAEGMVRGDGGEVFSVRVRGVDPRSVGEVTELRDDLIQGSIEALAAAAGNGNGVGSPGIVIGNQLAASLGASLGDEMLLISPFGGPPTPLGPAPRLKRFQIVGVFQSSFFQYDEVFTYVNLADAQDFRRAGDVVDGVEARTTDYYRSRQVGDAVRQRLDYPFYTRDWKEVFPAFFQALKTERMMMFMLLTMIMVVAAFVIVATLIMMIMEKSSDIAILKAMGADDSTIERIFAIEGTLMGLAGTLIGVVAGVAVTKQLAWVQARIEDLTGVDTLPASVYQFSTLPSEVDPVQIAGVAAIAMVLSLGATLLPSRQGARLDPAEGLRYE